MTVHDPNLISSMPPLARLPMLTQDLTASYSDPTAPSLAPIKSTGLFRLATLLPAILITFSLMVIFADWFHRDGFTATEVLMIGLVGFSSFWIAISVSASMIGLLFPRKEKPVSKMALPLNVALLMPIYNENPSAVFMRIKAMRDELAEYKSPHTYSIFVLSDTNDDRTALLEIQEFNRVRSTNGNQPPLWYRRRAENIERKTGNIRDWIENWGGDWDGFITLDADSLMSAKTINQLSNQLSVKTDTALIQTIPQLMSANTLFSRMQQFANNTYGGVLASGLDRWSGSDGNYWGHNAIIRTTAFSACAGLPKLSGNGALGGTIKSHDFVEAALLRRAGWSVRLMPSLDESYEETPQNIVDYVKRDHRWCQGNLQHLRIIASSGFTVGSRFHMLQGAIAYISSFIWFVLLTLWALMGRSEEHNVFSYFSDTNPLFPHWPEMDTVSRLVVLGFMLGLLLTPKILGVISELVQSSHRRTGTPWPLLILSSVLEILLSFMLAPILMVQHVKSVLRTILGYDSGWEHQNREGQNYGLLYLVQFHWFEVFAGFVLTSGIVTGLISMWLLPIAVCLSTAPVLSKIASISLPKFGIFSNLMATRENCSPPPILQTANQNHRPSGDKSVSGHVNDLV